MSIILSDVRLTTATVSLRISMWRGWKTSQEVSDAGADALSQASGQSVSKKQLRSSKRLVDEAPIKALERESNETKAYWRAATLPWNDEGERIVTTAKLTELTTYLDERQYKWRTQSVPYFESIYPQLMHDASYLLGPLYNRNNYPAPGEIAAHFGFYYRVQQLPDLDDFRLNGITQDQLDAYKTNAEAQIIDRFEQSQKVAWERLREPIAKMIETLSAYEQGNGHEGKFHHTLVGNIAKVVDALPGLNITGDDMLLVYGEAIKQALCSYDAKDLRESQALRDQVVDAATLLHQQMDQFI